MKKQEAIHHLGGSVRDAASAIGISVQAVYDWPDELTPAIVDRVIAACVRTGIKVPREFLERKPAQQEGA